MRATTGASMALPASAFATPALAEVCDKVVEGNALLYPVWGGPSALVLVAAIAATVVLIEAPRLGYVLAAVFLMLALLEAGIFALLSGDEVFTLALEEGCLSAPWKLGGVLMLVALAAISIWRGSRWRRAGSGLTTRRVNQCD